MDTTPRPKPGVVDEPLRSRTEFQTHLHLYAYGHTAQERKVVQSWYLAILRLQRQRFGSRCLKLSGQMWRGSSQLFSTGHNPTHQMSALTQPKALRIKVVLIQRLQVSTVLPCRSDIMTSGKLYYIITVIVMFSRSTRQTRDIFISHCPVDIETIMFADTPFLAPISAPPLPSNRHHRRCGDCLEGKGENYQVCSVQYCVQQLCTVRCTHI